LLCPNAASRGWIGVANDANHEPNRTDDEGAAQTKELEFPAAQVNVEKEKFGVMAEGLSTCEVKQEEILCGEKAGGATGNCNVLSSEQIISESKNLGDAAGLFIPEAVVAAAKSMSKTPLINDNAITTRKRPRSDAGEVSTKHDLIELTPTPDESKTNDKMLDGAELASFHDNKKNMNKRTTEAHPVELIKNETNGNSLTITTEYETDCSCLHCKTRKSSEEQDSNSASSLPNLCANEKGQIVTISHACSQVSKVVIIASVSGRAKIELLPIAAGVLGDQQKGAGDDNDHGLLLDIFGYRLSYYTIKEIEIDRPDWMNALPLSIICPSGGKVGVTKKIRVRIKSIHSDKSSDPIKEVDCYYGAHPEETYQLTIYSPATRSTCDNTMTERKTGVTFISDPWRNVADKIVNGVENTGITLATNATPQAAETQDATTAEISTHHNRILVCGAKGVGKSTFLRYMANRILSSPSDGSDTNNHRIAILDLDCGQSELCPPGLLTLTVVSKPFVSDPPMLMVCNGRGSTGSSGDVESCNNNDGIVETVVASYFFGDITSKSDPDTYIHIAKILLCKYQELIALASTSTDKQPMPLLINTDGWVKGLGFEILSAIVGVSSPSHIVQILGSTKAKSFDMAHFHSGEEKILQRDEQPGMRCSVHVIQSFDEYTNPVENGSKPHHSGSLDSTQSTSTGTLLATASEHRAHRICAYFLNGCSNLSTLRTGIVGDDTPVCFHREKGLVDPSNAIGLVLASMLPYAVPFHSIRLYPPSGLMDSISEVSPEWGICADLACNDVLDSLSGSVVGLCCEPDLSGKTNNNAGCGVPVLPCVGLGIIRSIDHICRIFYVLSPVHPELLCSVTSFVGGNVGLPLECVYRGVYSDSFPYQSFGQVMMNAGLGSEVMRSRNHSGRKSNA
jgi:hypothetical protein